MPIDVDLHDQCLFVAQDLRYTSASMLPTVSRNSHLTQAWLLFAAMGLLIAAVRWGFKVAAATRTTFGATAAWPVVTGRIIESRIIDRGGGARYCPFIRYAYDLDGTVFHASRIALLSGDPSMCSRDQESAARLVRTYPVDGRVPVHYDPVEPGRSALEVHQPTWLQAIPQSAYITIFVLLVVVLRQAVLMWFKRLRARA